MSETRDERETSTEDCEGLGLALSGGGFRAVLFHLGVIRYLRATDRLGCVTHLSSVSGGSIVAAHLAQNWNRYVGSPRQFHEAERELIRLVKRGVHRRVIRRIFWVALLKGITLTWVIRRVGLLRTILRKVFFNRVVRRFPGIRYFYRTRKTRYGSIRIQAIPI